MKKKLFGTDGIRGRVGEFPINQEFSMLLGVAISIFFKKKFKHGVVLIGCDTRESSDSLSMTLSLGINSGGVDVFHVGVVPSSCISVIIKNNSNIKIGCMISASHNQFCDNGFKFFSSDGLKFSRELEEELLYFISRAEKSIGNASRGKIFNRNDLSNFYINFISNLKTYNLSTIKKLKIVIDCANGSFSKLDIFSNLANFIDFVYINNNPNGKNINYDCGSENPRGLSSFILSNNADMGFAFDGDGDRIVFCDSNGDVVDFNHLMALYILFYKATNDINGIVSTNAINAGLINFTEKEGLFFATSETGDINIVNKMKEKSAIIGGEPSGHFIFGDICYLSDSAVSVIQTINALNFLSLRSSDLSKLFEIKPQKMFNYYYNDYDLIYNFVNSCKFEQIINSIKNSQVYFRFSGTEKCLRVLVKSDSAENVSKSVDFILKSIDKNLINNF